MQGTGHLSPQQDAVLGAATSQSLSGLQGSLPLNARTDLQAMVTGNLGLEGLQGLSLDTARSAGLMERAASAGTTSYCACLYFLQYLQPLAAYETFSSDACLYCSLSRSAHTITSCARASQASLGIYRLCCLAVCVGYSVIDRLFTCSQVPVYRTG